MGQDYPFTNALANNYAHQFFTQMEPEWLEECYDAISAICENHFQIEPEYGRIAVYSEDDAKRLAELDYLYFDEENYRAIAHVPFERTFSQVSYEIRKEYRRFDVQVNYYVGEARDSIYYLSGKIFIRPFSGEKVDFQPVADQIAEKYGDLGVTVTSVDPDSIICLHVAGH